MWAWWTAVSSRSNCLASSPLVKLRQTSKRALTHIRKSQRLRKNSDRVLASLILVNQALADQYIRALPAAAKHQTRLSVGIQGFLTHSIQPAAMIRGVWTRLGAIMRTVQFQRSLSSAQPASSTSHPNPSATALVAAGAKLRIAVALSGGVDSAVAALRLIQQGHQVFGIFMKNWDTAEEGEHPGVKRSGQCYEADLRDAGQVARQLGIHLHECDFVRQYWDKVFSEFLSQYAAGGTPNPDLACNKHIKFGSLLAVARQLGAQAVATGHYARLAPSSDGRVRLLSGCSQDQSYFLAGLDLPALDHVLFPVGHSSKAEVRAEARAAGLAPAAKRSSTGICFIGPRKFSDFMAQYVPPVAGQYVCVDTGRQLGVCPDILPLTVGQKAAIGGRSDSTRLYVAGKDLHQRVVYVAAGHEHPALHTRTVLLGPITWLTPSLPVKQEQGRWQIRCQFRAAYRQTSLGACTLTFFQGPCASFSASRLHVLLGNASGLATQSEGHENAVLQHQGLSSIRSVMQRAAVGVPTRVVQGGHEALMWQASGVAVFDEPVYGVAPCQVLVLHQGDQVLGSALMLLPATG